MFNPQHVKDGVLLPSAISLTELRSRGFSVHGLEYVTAEFVKASIEERLSRPRKGTPWRDEGVALLEAFAVRSLGVNEQQAFVVIDTATGDNRGHASIHAADPRIGESQAREIRSLLLPLVQERMSVDTAFERV